MNPYDTLDVPTDADTATIKSAYRKKAKQHHPDRGGKREAFESINRASMVLLDPVRREKYDRTGDVDDVSPDNSQSHAISLIVGWFSAVVMQSATQQQDPCNTDLVEQCRDYLKQQLDAFKKQKAPIERAAKLMKKIAGRLKNKTKKPSALLLRALDAQVQATAVPLREIDGKIAMHNDALKLLDEYGFDVEQRAQEQTRYMQGGWIFQQN